MLIVIKLGRVLQITGRMSNQLCVESDPENSAYFVCKKCSVLQSVKKMLVCKRMQIGYLLQQCRKSASISKINKKPHSC